MGNEKWTGLSYDQTVLKDTIVELMDKMSVEQLRMLCITARVWAETE